MDAEQAAVATILHALRASAERNPRGTALSCQGVVLCYADLARAVRSLAAQLSELGVEGECLAVLLPTSIEAVVVVLAGLLARAEVVPINPFFTASELRAVLPEVAPKVIVVGGDARAKVDAVALGERGPRVVFIEAGATEQWLSQLLSRTDPGWPAFPEALAVAVALFTGGTTGQPKAVLHTHASLMMSVRQHCSVWPLERDQERVLSAAPIFHIWGLFYATFVPMHAGAALVLVPRFAAGEVLACLEKERITVFGGGPAPVYLSLLQSDRVSTTDFRSLKYCLTGGAPCPRELHTAWLERTGCPLLEGWGMSEMAPLCLSRPGMNKPASVGGPVPDTEIEVVDVETGATVLGPGQVGELRVRGPQRMLGYRRRPEDTALVVRDGWLYTGDIGYRDDQGDVFLVDRKKDMIIVGGYNVYPRTVDEVLYQHPAIAEVATVGRPEPRLGEELVAFVVRRPGADLEEAAFFDFCRRELVKYRRPVQVLFLQALPRTAARKIDRRALRALAAQPPG